jgi:hypothetical protein
MNFTSPTRAAAAAMCMPLVALAPLLLTACGSNADNAPAVSVAELAAGAYEVSTGDGANPTAGKYYAGADGSRFLVLNNSGQQASAVYRRDGNGSWQMTPPATANTTLELLHSNPVPATTIELPALARSYTVRLAAGTAATFSVNASGDIVAGATGCKLSGKLAATTLPNALKASLTSAGCGDLPAQSDGFLIVDKDYAPAAFRLVASSGANVVDLWAYPE